jgi:hypothetical protein
MSQTKAQLINAVDGSIVDADIVGLTSSKLSGALPAVSAANLTNIPAANLTGALPAISGANLTGISAGKVLQVVHFSTTTQFSTSSGSFVDVTNFNADIVPQTNSKVLVQVTLMSILTSATTGGEGFGIKILRGSTAVLTSGGMYDIYDNAQGVSGAHSRNRSTWTVLDSSPGGDGSTTLNYKIQIGSHNAQSVQISEGNMTSSMTLFEIGA